MLSTCLKILTLLIDLCMRGFSPQEYKKRMAVSFMPDISHVDTKKRLFISQNNKNQACSVHHLFEICNVFRLLEQVNCFSI